MTILNINSLVDLDLPPVELNATVDAGATFGVSLFDINCGYGTVSGPLGVYLPIGSAKVTHTDNSDGDQL